MLLYKIFFFFISLLNKIDKKKEENDMGTREL